MLSSDEYVHIQCHGNLPIAGTSFSSFEWFEIRSGTAGAEKMRTFHMTSVWNVWLRHMVAVYSFSLFTFRDALTGMKRNISRSHSLYGKTLSTFIACSYLIMPSIYKRVHQRVQVLLWGDLVHMDIRDEILISSLY